nr:Cystathionine beta-synthase domain containing protein [Haemonchus contortus]
MHKLLGVVRILHWIQLRKHGHELDSNQNSTSWRQANAALASQLSLRRASKDRFTDPYRHYMQSLTCYDLQPPHGAVVIIDGELKIHKALTALSQCGHQAAIVSNLDVKGGFGIITITDCLRAIILASEGVQKVAEQTVAQFLKSNNRKQLVTANVNTSVWDAAKMICLNRIHRVPIIQVDENYANSEARKQQGTLLYVLSLRNVFTQAVVKLSDPNPSLCSHIKQKTVCEQRVGTWTRVQTVGPVYGILPTFLTLGLGPLLG